MGEQELNALEAVGGQPTQVPTDEQGGALDSGPAGKSVSEGLTKEQVLQLVQEAIGQAEPDIIGKATRHAQSLTDKATKRLSTRIEELKQAGVEVNAEQRYKLEKVISEQVHQEEGGSVGAGANQQGQSGQNVEQENPLIAMTRERQKKLIEKYGTEIKKEDQEFKLINWQSPDPFTFLDEYEAQLKSKLSRQKNANVEEDSEEVVSSMALADSRQGRVPDNTKGMSSLDLISSGLKSSDKQRARR